MRSKVRGMCSKVGGMCSKVRGICGKFAGAESLEQTVCVVK